MDRRQTGRRTAQNWARARLRFGPRAAHVAPFALVSIKTPLGSSVWPDPELEQVV